MVMVLIVLVALASALIRRPRLTAADLETPIDLAPTAGGQPDGPATIVPR